MFTLIINNKSYLWQKNPERFEWNDSDGYHNYTKKSFVRRFKDSPVIVLENGIEVIGSDQKCTVKDIFDEPGKLKSF